jgi:hypothetical protein
MGRTKLKIWLLLLGWLWMQPVLAQHPLEADLPGHNHACVLCALHLDGKLALTPTLRLHKWSSARSLMPPCPTPQASPSAHRAPLHRLSG